MIFLLIIIIITLGIQLYNKEITEGFTNGFQLCKPNDIDYSVANTCYDISYIDQSNSKVNGKARLDSNYYINYNNLVTKITDTSKYVAADNKKGYKPFRTNGIQSICDPSDSLYSDINTCYDISYVDNKNMIQSTKAKISPSYYIDPSTNFIKPIPYGFISTNNKHGYIAKTQIAGYEKSINDMIDASINFINGLKNNTIDKSIIAEYDKQIRDLSNQRLNIGVSNPSGYDTSSNKAYNSDNYDITYHADPTKGESKDDNSAGPGKMWVKDMNGNLVAMQYSDLSNTSLYYEPGSYPFGPSNYVPNYEESVYLSKLTNESTTTPIKNASYQTKGFCEENKNFPNKIEEKCKTLDNETCASTACCVSLGGQKCVSGTKEGPINKANYSDFTINNRDFYYYKGKCYGNCVEKL